jgi:hypothetical protein
MGRRFAQAEAAVVRHDRTKALRGPRPGSPHSSWKHCTSEIFTIALPSARSFPTPGE